MTLRINTKSRKEHILLLRSDNTDTLLIHDLLVITLY